MKSVILSSLVCTVLFFPAFNALAQTPYDRQSPGQHPYVQMPFMQGMPELDEKYRKIEEQKKQERKVITDQIYAEELAKAKQSQAPDPYAASEWAARQRLMPIHEQWKKDDQALEAKKYEEMMSSTGMGDMLRNQQEMMKQYGQPAPYPASR